MKPELLIISHKWETNRSENTSVEYFCNLLSPNFNVTNGKNIKINYRIGRIIKYFSNSKIFANFSAPYNSHYAGQELWGIIEFLKLKPKVVFFPYADYNYNYFWILKKFFKFKLVLYTYFSEFELENRFKSLSHFKRADLILAAGKTQVNYLKSILPKNNIFFFPLGVNTSFFTPSLNYTKYKIIHSGANRRDFKTLFTVVEKLHNIYPQLKVSLIGCDTVKKTLSIPDFVEILPFLNDNELKSVYQSAHIQLLLLNDGGSSNSLNEGMACGLPLIITDMPNITDYVDDTCVIKVPLQGEDEIIKACQRIFESNFERDRLATAARSQILKYDWDNLRINFNLIINSI